MKRACVHCGGMFEAKTCTVVCRDCGPARYYSQQRAMSAVQAAVRDRVLPNLRVEAVCCVDCGERATCYDHRNYSLPVAVAPVCRTCNSKRGSAPSGPLADRIAAIASYSMREVA